GGGGGGGGGGIDCFIASKKVGPRGSVIGVDMTDNMLEVANESKKIVINNLGYENVQFRKGFLEEIPSSNKSIDLVTSNCVINLSPNKKKVFSEILRVLKDNGRLVVSDIVSDKVTSEEIKINRQLWGECLAGALTENQFLSFLEQSGFYGIELLKKDHWKNIENINFYSVTVRAFKFEKSPSCVFQGHKAIYNGPYKVIIDDEGHVFPRNQEVEVCTDTVSKLSNPPYQNCFTILEPSGDYSAACCNSDNNDSCC
ncbi:MAG: methyltransferase domain-containing protein, partial [Thermodesulfobacteriota bacterium]